MNKHDIVCLFEAEIAQRNESAIRFPTGTSRKLVTEAIKEVMARHDREVAGFAPYGFHEWKIEYAR